MFEVRKWDDKRNEKVGHGRTVAEKPNLLFFSDRLARL
jgi:hypothetical protein